MLTRFYFTLLFFLAQPYCFAQSNQPYSTLSSVIPPSPNAASLTQAGFSDVNLYTGKASYSLSLYTVSQNTGGGGIRVEEVASSVGLGWSITSAGAVSRAIRGRADDTYAGSYIGYIHLPDFDPATVTYDSAFNYAKNKHDGQPDIYSVNVAGISAQFYINKSKKVVFVEKTDLKIEPVFSGYEIIAFELKDTNGRLSRRLCQNMVKKLFRLLIKAVMNLKPNNTCVHPTSISIIILVMNKWHLMKVQIAGVHY